MKDMDRESELALVRRLRDGDPDAFDEVHAAFNTRLLTFLVRLSRRRDVAEDLLEETWLRFVRKAASLAPDTTLGAWLFTVARNRYFSFCRARALDELNSTGLLSLWPLASPLASPFDEAAASESQRRLEAALTELPASYREALLLVGVDGMTPAEAAAVCGVSPETMRQRLHRARTELARRLDRYGSAPLTWREVTP
jgi:RNA polymerase sigma-70 factor (ECF subfamily)